MSEAVLDIKRWGNSLGVRLPSPVAKAAGLKADQTVRVSVEGGRVVIAPVESTELSLEARLALFDPALHGGEALPVRPVGNEVW